MTAREQDLLTSPSLLKNGTALPKLIQSCLINKLVDPNTLLSGDRNALLISIRVSGYGPNYKVSVNCPHCEELFDFDFDLSSLPIKNLSVEPLQENTNVFEFVLPLSKKVVLFKLLTGKDELELMKELERKKKTLKSQISNSFTARIFKSILSIDGIEDRAKLANMVSNMLAGDSIALTNYMKEIEPEVSMKQFGTCPHCGEEEEFDMPLEANFFFPG